MGRKDWKKPAGLLILDIYITRKFLGTFFFAISLLMLITIIFDLSEKLDEFMEHEAPVNAIVFRLFFKFHSLFCSTNSPSVYFYCGNFLYITHGI
jgi:lipopolysaccharide export system permease protein